MVDADIDRNKVPDRERDGRKGHRKAAVVVEVGEVKWDVTSNHCTNDEFDVVETVGVRLGQPSLSSGLGESLRSCD